ncbi:MAG: L-glyceraldehyde 3-phosphate reductase [Clostridiaceae bacterium]|nr:L-glyceraldehyde 3-phosphate reductase [Clostridiaceae bacterium]
MYEPANTRYEKMFYRRCGNSGLKLPAISLGLWHNFGDITPLDVQKKILRQAFDMGITHFDLANNYGPEYGAAERNFGFIFKTDFVPFRDELIISTKAGYDMWPGPYGNFGSKKYLIASLNQSLKRMGLDYVDIFYHHRPDYETPLEETMGALALAVQQGKALYVGISNYKPEETRKAAAILKELKTPCLIHQPNYSMLDRWIEDGLLDVLEQEGIGSIVFKPLEQGMLTGKYSAGIPEDSRAARDPRYLKNEDIDEKTLYKINKLGKIAEKRGQTLAQMAIAWTLRGNRVTSALIGASKPSQIIENVKALDNLEFSKDELDEIDALTR